jgi:hypothetical protein
VPSTKDIDLKNDPHKILLVGENGMGKSIAAASFFKAGPIRIWDFDGRLKPVKSYYPDADINYDTFTAENFRSFIDEINNLANNCPYKTLVLDSVTTASTLCVTFQLGVKGKLKTSKAGLPETSWDEINGETVLFTQMLEAMKLVHKKHKCHIIWTAHPVPKIEISDEGTKRLTSLAAYGNKIPALIPGYFDEIYNFTRMKTGISDFKYLVNTVPMNNLPGKTAFPDKIPAQFDITKKNFYETLMGFLNS